MAPWVGPKPEGSRGCHLGTRLQLGSRGHHWFEHLSDRSRDQGLQSVAPWSGIWKVTREWGFCEHFWAPGWHSLVWVLLLSYSRSIQTNDFGWSLPSGGFCGRCGWLLSWVPYVTIRHLVLFVGRGGHSGLRRVLFGSRFVGVGQGLAVPVFVERVRAAPDR